MNKICLTFLLIIVATASTPSKSLAWGKRGHEIVASVAGELLVRRQNDKFLISHEFDLGYYANVPDIIWRKFTNLSNESDPEKPQHFLDWNADFAQVFGSPKNLPVSFKEYKAKMGAKFKRSLGLAPWRIQSLFEQCKETRASLKSVNAGEMVVEKSNQLKLLTCMGEMSHYTADLSQPLHVTENFDGYQSRPPEPGIHAYFETDVVNAIGPKLKEAVLQKALKLYDKIKPLNMKAGEAVRYLIADSLRHVNELLNKGQGLDFSEAVAGTHGFQSLVTERLAIGSVITALIWNEILTDVKTVWIEKDFYNFDGSPDYVAPLFESEK